MASPFDWLASWWARSMELMPLESIALTCEKSTIRFLMFSLLTSSSMVDRNASLCRKSKTSSSILRTVSSLRVEMVFFIAQIHSQTLVGESCCCFWVPDGEGTFVDGAVSRVPPFLTLLIKRGKKKSGG